MVVVGQLKYTNATKYNPKKSYPTKNDKQVNMIQPQLSNEDHMKR